MGEDRGLKETAAEVREAIRGAASGLVDRAPLIELVALSAVAREHVLVIGPPGTAKSEAVRRIARAFDGRYFEYLLGRFTEPSEIFGPVDLRKLKEGIVETETTNMLPEAELAFLDEVFLGSTAILNTLLAVLNERTFTRGHTRVACPLRVCVGAANALPEDEALAAFADRFLARIFVDSVEDPRLEELLEGGWSLERSTLAPVPLDRLDRLAEAARATNLDGIRGGIAQAIRLLRKNAIALSDRRAVKLQKLVAAAAILDGRTKAEAQDLWPIVYAVPTEGEQSLARDVLRDLLAPSENATLPAAAEEASAGPAARSARLVEAGEALLLETPEDRAAWKLRLEGVAREIDAGFAPNARPAALDALRGRIVAALEAP